MRLVRDFFQAGKPAGVICHGPWTLVEANVVRGRTLTSWPTLATDIRNAGGTWVDQEAVTDQDLVTSCGPDDLPAFCAKIVQEFAEGSTRHRPAARRPGPGLQHCQIGPAHGRRVRYSARKATVRSGQMTRLSGSLAAVKAG